MKISQKDAENNVNKRCTELNIKLLNCFIYTNVRKTRLRLLCEKDNYEWETSYASFVLRKSKCPKCSNCAKINTIEAIQKILKLCEEKNYILLEKPDLLKTKTKIHLKCNKDNYEWWTTYNNFIKNRGCAKCAKKTKPTQSSFLSLVLNRCKELNYNLMEIPKYKNSKTKIHLKCNKDNHEWWVNYNSFINRKSKCSKCSCNLKITQNEANNNVTNKCEKNNYSLIEPIVYKNNETKVHLKCNKDNYEWWTTYNNFINGNRGCSTCGNKYDKSENIIKEMLVKNNIEFIHIYKNKLILGRQSLDFYLPEHKIGIEYQGIQHFKPSSMFGGNKAYTENIKRDIRKFELCKKNNIKLFYVSFIKKLPQIYFDKIYSDINDLIFEINAIIK